LWELVSELLVPNIIKIIAGFQVAIENVGDGF